MVELKPINKEIFSDDILEDLKDALVREYHITKDFADTLIEGFEMLGEDLTVPTYPIEKFVENRRKFLQGLTDSRNLSFMKKILSGEIVKISGDPSEGGDFRIGLAALFYNHALSTPHETIASIVAALPEIINRKAKDKKASVYFIGSEAHAGKTALSSLLTKSIVNFAKEILNLAASNKSKEEMYEAAKGFVKAISPLFEDSFGELGLDIEKYSKALVDSLLEYFSEVDRGEIRGFDVHADYDLFDISLLYGGNIVAKADSIRTDEEALLVKRFIAYFSKDSFPFSLFVVTTNMTGVQISKVREIFDDTVSEPIEGVLSRRGIFNFVRTAKTPGITNRLMRNALWLDYHDQKMKFLMLSNLIKLAEDEDKYGIIDENYQAAINAIHDENLRQRVMESYERIKKIIKEKVDSGVISDEVKEIIDDILNNTYEHILDSLLEDGHTDILKDFSELIFDNETEADEFIKHLKRVIYSKNENIFIENTVLKKSSGMFTSDKESKRNKFKNRIKKIKENKVSPKDLDNKLQSDIDKYKKIFIKELENIIKEVKERPEKLEKYKDIPSKEGLKEILGGMKIDENKYSILSSYTSLENVFKFNHYNLCKIVDGKLELDISKLFDQRAFEQFFTELVALKKYLKPDVFRTAALARIMNTYGLNSPISEALIKTFEVIY